MTLAELVIKLSADTASLRTDFDKAKGYARSFSSEMQSVLGTIGVGFGLGMVAREFEKVTIAAGDFGKQIEMASQKTGMGAKDISGLKFAAEQSEIGFDTLQVALARFSKNLVDTTGHGAPAAKMLQGLGISAADTSGHMRPMHELLLSVADRFSKMPDGAIKAADAIALFGRGGAALIPLLDQGSAGIKGLEEQAGLLGVIMGGEASSAAAKFHDSLGMLESGMRGFGIQVANAVIPSLNDLLVRLVSLREESSHPWEGVLKDFWTGETVIAAAIPAAFMDVVTWSDKGSQALANWAGRASVAGHSTNELTSHIAALNAALAAASHTGSESGGVGKTLKPIGPYGPPDLRAANEFKQYEQLLKAANTSQESNSESLLSFIAKMSKEHDAWVVIDSDMAKMSEAWDMGIVEAERYHEVSLKIIQDAEKIADEALRKQGIPSGGIGFPSLGDAKIPSLGITKQQLEGMNQAAMTFSHDVSQGFVGLVTGSESLGQVFKHLAMQLAEMVIQAELFKLLTGGLSAQGKPSGGGLIGGGTGLLGSLFGAMSKFGGFLGLAGGGPVASYTPYVVGEKGPELFVPDVGGRIVPGGQGGGGGGHGDINIDARGADASVEHRVMAAMQAYYKQSAVNGYLTAWEMGRRS